jgi:hypothetical protein
MALDRISILDSRGVFSIYPGTNGVTPFHVSVSRPVLIRIIASVPALTARAQLWFASIYGKVPRPSWYPSWYELDRLL